MPAPILIQATLAIPASHAAAWMAGSTTLMATTGGATTTLVSGGTIVGTATLTAAAPAAAGAATGVVGGGVAASTGVAALVASAPVIVPVAAAALAAVGGTMAVFGVKRARTKRRVRAAVDASATALQVAEDIVDGELALCGHEAAEVLLESDRFRETSEDQR